jgi:Rad52/22 family double-strand break repair protein
MAFTDQQARQLKAKLDAQHVKTRKANGLTLSYIEGWHAIAEANRIFGFDGWDRRTLFTNCIWTGTCERDYLAAYTARVRIYVRAGEVLIVREGSGSGEGKGVTPGQAHEIALKSAETDATKRALATFGNVFGLALYDREQAGVRHHSKTKTAPPEPIAKGPWVVHSAGGVIKGKFDKPVDFVRSLKEAMTEARNIERLFEIWEQNVTTVRTLNASRQAFGLAQDFAPSLVAHLKGCAVALVKPDEATEEATREGDLVAPKAGPRIKERPRIDKSVLTIGEPKRIRSKAHLRFVARQPCLICGRAPSHAHHVRYAQSRGLGLKVSDEFTVPLCAIHHSENHATGDERRWWEEHKIDPLVVANTLWHHGRMPVSASGQETASISQGTNTTKDE